MNESYLDEAEGEPLAEMDRLVADLFCGTISTYGSFRAPAGRAVRGRQLLPHTLYRYDLVDSVSERAVTVQIYVGVSQLGGDLWKQELRVLQRVASLRHPALPAIKHGGHIEEEVAVPYGFRGCAFVVTDAGMGQLFEGADQGELRAGLVEVIEYLRQNRRVAMAQFMSLADALAILHDMHIVHRNIWPGILDRIKLDGEDQMVLGRFELSRLTSNLLRTSMLNAQERAENARTLVLAQGGGAIAYFSPERIRFLLEEGAHLEDHRSDVYSLGMMVAEWMTGPIPEDLLAEVETAVRSRNGVGKTLDAVKRVNLHLMGLVRALPPALASLLKDMTVWDMPTGRLSASDVVNRISEHYEHLTYERDDATTNPYLLIFMPDKCRKTIFRWEMVDQDPDSDDGRLETAEFILDDLKEARVLHVPGGAASFIPGEDKKKLAAADQILLGRSVAWFCRLYENERGGFSRRGLPDERGLLLTFAIQLDTSRGRALRATVEGARKRRWVSQLRVVASDIARSELDAALAESPSWQPLLDAVRDVAPQSKAEREYAQAFDWLLQFQRIELEARRYPYVVERSDQVDRVALRFDEERDRYWRHGSALATVFAGTPSLRPKMGDFFAGNAGEDGETLVSLRADDNGVAAWTESFRGECVEGTINDMVTIEVGRRSRVIPERGWISPADDIGSWMALNRQEEARHELLMNRTLIEQLDRPNAITSITLSKHSTGTQVAEAMMATEPLFALQGPPGTGKTEVTADAVVKYLAEERGARVLISTQSNFALDNIAERLLGKLDLLSKGRSSASHVVPVRATGLRGEGKVDGKIEPFLIHRLAENTLDQLKSHARSTREKYARNPGVIGLLEGWDDVVDSCLPELIDRLQRAANLVFATCSSATPATLEKSASADIFDWVVIEEAAKAWPTELAIPLARGTRWSLVGDHRQLSAHRSREILRFLDSCAASSDEDLRVHGERRDEYLRVFGMFGNLFSDNAKRSGNKPRHTLRKQYRMRPAINEIVSRVFYPVDNVRSDGHVDITVPGLLSTGRDDIGVLHAPMELANAVVWVDTSNIAACSDEPAWRNPGEVDVVKTIVERMRPRPLPGKDGYGDHPLAVLTPYRRQLDLLRAYSEIRPFASTIHAFQGREANVVVISLTRDQRRGKRETPWSNIGHLHERELVNVLFSRAREHLVLVGSLRHFERYGGPMWSDVCALVRQQGRVVSGGFAGIRS
ncbi:AAA domain-containing protein [Amycolatopsis sp. cg5]|uniref:AAA domain-containing protein n=1 Tax=Amycolatopsis sp. cg5 TaxID=3238802 RepID=UPI003523FE1C